MMSRRRSSRRSVRVGRREHRPAIRWRINRLAGCGPVLYADQSEAGRGAAMRWYAREKSGDIWDEAIEWPLGDIEAAERIRSICQFANASAELVGSRVAGGKASAAKQHQRESERYERAARAAMEIAMKISDDLMRD